MTRMIASLLVSLVLLTGCQQLLPIGGDQERTFALRYDGSVPPSKPDAPLLFIDDPLMAEGLGGQSLTVVLSDGERTALKDVRWATGSASLIRDYLDRYLMARSDAAFVGEGGLDIRTRCRLQTKVWAFEFRPGATPEEDRVFVWIEAALVSILSGDLLERSQVTSEHPVAGDDPSDVVAALDAALERVARDLIPLVDNNLETCR